MIKLIKLKNFRLFDYIEINTNFNFIIFSGNNAIGKTSVLESLYLISTTKSHRTDDINKVIKKDKQYSSIEIEEKNNYKIILSPNTKKTFINNVEVKKITDFIGKIDVVLFSPQDINLVLGKKIERRNFLNVEISLLDKNYLYHATMYKKILRERNDLLKNENVDLKLLDIITDMLIKEILFIYNARVNFVENLNRKIKEICNDISFKEKIDITYQKTYDDKNIKCSFNSKRKYDILTKTTNIGIHRDDFIININNLPLCEYGSQGQIKSVLIIIKIALKEIIKEVKKTDPILLLDDIFSELDFNRQDKLLKYLNSDNQVFITTTSILNIPNEIIKDSKVISLEKNN